MISPFSSIASSLLGVAQLLRVGACASGVSADFLEMKAAFFKSVLICVNLRLPAIYFAGGYSKGLHHGFDTARLRLDHAKAQSRQGE